MSEVQDTQEVANGQELVAGMTNQQWLEIEVRVMATLVSKQLPLRSHIIGQLMGDDQFIFFPKMWKKLRMMLQNNMEMDVEPVSLTVDADIGEFEGNLAQGVLDTPPITNHEETARLVDHMRYRYYQGKLMKVLVGGAETVSGHKMTIEESIGNLQDTLEGLLKEAALKESVGLGDGQDVSAVAEKLFGNKEKTRLIKTGIAEIDNRAGGLAVGEQVILACPTSSGKCHGANTPIRMADGSIKRVQDIVTGDLIMGPDGKPRRVLKLARGKQAMWKVRQFGKGRNYTVNQGHVLSLKHKVTGHTVNVPIEQYRNLWDQERRDEYAGWAVPGVLNGDLSYELRPFRLERTRPRKYYGFEVSGDNLYLMGDFTVTHNTTFMNQLLINMTLGMANRKYVNEPNSGLLISLEMSEEEMWQRIAANLCGIETLRLRQPDLLMTQEERDQCVATLEGVSKYLAQSGKRLILRGADFGNVDSIRAELAAHQFDIVGVDYLNLMCESEQLWMEMGKIARDLKILAQKRKFVCITAAQLDEDSLKIRYSRMVKEHCDVVLMWQPAVAAADANGEVQSVYTEIFVDKGRNMGKFSFWVHFNFPYMIVSSVDPAKQLGMYAAPQSAANQLALPKSPPNAQAPLAALAAPAAQPMTNLLADIAQSGLKAQNGETVAVNEAAPQQGYANLSQAGMPGGLPAGVLMPTFNAFGAGTVTEDIKTEVATEVSLSSIADQDNLVEI